MFGFNLKIRKEKLAKQLESFFLFEIFRLKESGFLAHSVLFLSNDGIRGVTYHCSASIVNWCVQSLPGLYD